MVTGNNERVRACAHVGTVHACTRQGGRQRCVGWRTLRGYTSGGPCGRGRASTPSSCPSRAFKRRTESSRWRHGDTRKNNVTVTSTCTRLEVKGHLPPAGGSSGVGGTRTEQPEAEAGAESPGVRGSFPRTRAQPCLGRGSRECAHTFPEEGGHSRPPGGWGGVQACPAARWAAEGRAAVTPLTLEGIHRAVGAPGFPQGRGVWRGRWAGSWGAGCALNHGSDCGRQMTKFFSQMSFSFQSKRPGSPQHVENLRLTLYLLLYSTINMIYRKSLRPL